MKKALFLILAACFTPLSFIQAQDGDYYDGSEETILQACESTLKTWNDAINARDEEQLSSTYWGIVKYYQSYYTIEQVNDSHARFFKKNAYYHQYCDNLELQFYNNCQALLTFDKHVQTAKGQPYKTYSAYIHFLYDYQEGAIIISESDVTTDTNLEKRYTLLEVDNDTPLDAIFCEANVGKKIAVDYWELVELGEKEDGPLANLILTSGFARSYIDGTITKDYNGQKGTYSCGGFAVGGECQAPVIFTYNPATGEMHCIGGAEE